MYNICLSGTPYIIPFSQKTPTCSNLLLDRPDRKRTSTGYQNHDFKTCRRTWMVFAKTKSYNIHVYGTYLPHFLIFDEHSLYTSTRCTLSSDRPT